MSIYLCPCEGTPGATVTASNVGATPNFAGVQTSMTVSATHVAHGSTALTASADNYAWWTSTSDKVLTRSYVWVPSAPTGEKPLLQIRHAGGLAAQLVINAAGYARVSTAGTGATTTRATDTNLFPTGQFVRCELYAEAGSSTTTGAVRAAIYAGDSNTPLWDTGLLTGYDLAGTNAAFTTQRIQVLSGAWTDSIGMKDGVDAVWGAWSANTPPVLTMPANVNATAGSTVNLTATATDDGSIASYAWTVVSADSTSTPTLTGASTATVSLTAPTAGNLVKLQLVVTDNNGATTTGTVEVRVPTSASELRPLAKDGVVVGTWTIAGGSSTNGAALADESNTTYVESPDATASEATLRVRLQPSQPRTALTVSVALQMSASSTDVVKVRLYEGSTLRQEWTPTVTTSLATSSLTVSSPGAISDFGNLWLEFAVRTA